MRRFSISPDVMAATAVPPPPRMATAANCAEPANTSTEKPIVSQRWRPAWLPAAPNANPNGATAAASDSRLAPDRPPHRARWTRRFGRDH